MPDKNSNIVNEALIDSASLIPIEQMKLISGLPPSPPALPTNDVVVAMGSQFGVKIRQTPPFGGGVPITPLSKIAPSGSPQSNAAAQTVATKVVQTAIAAIPPAPASTPAITDGLIHGYETWEDDPAYICLRDDFIMGGNTTLSQYGDLAWYCTNPAGAIWIGDGSLAMPNTFGVLRLGVSSNANQNAILIPGSVFLMANSNADIIPYSPLFDYPLWEMTWVFVLQRYQLTETVTTPFPTLANTSFYLGLANMGYVGYSTTVPRPPIFMGLRYDRDTTSPSIADSTFKFEAVVNADPQTPARNNTQGNIYNTTFAPAEFTMYRFSMRCLVAGQVQMRLVSNAAQDTGWQTLAVPQQSWTGATANFGNGIVRLSSITGAGSSNYITAGSGSKINVTGWSGGSDGAAFIKTNCRFNDVSLTWMSTTNGSTANQSGATFTYYPGVYFFCSWGNDSESTPSNNRVLLLDFFSFLWNPGVDPANSLTADSTKARFF